MLTVGLSSCSSPSLVVTSVLSNFLCDAGGLTDSSNHLQALSSEITDHVQVISNFAAKNPLSRFVIVPPLPRSVPTWFAPYLPGLTAQLCSEVTKLGTAQICCIAPFIAPPSFFESDGYHLNKAAGIDFVKYIIESVDQVFPVLQCQSLPAPSSSLLLPLMDTPPPIQTHTDLSSLSSAVTELSAITQKYRNESLSRRSQDNLVFARLKEDRDFELNKARENRFTISGLKLRGDQVPPSDPVLRKDFFKTIIQGLVDEACPDVDPKPVVMDVYVNMRRGLGAPFFEVRMDSVASSTVFRVAGSKLAKSDPPSPNFSGLFIANAVTLTTRVRIEILRALSKVLSSDTQDAFVIGFTSRPVLLVKAKSPEDTESMGETSDQDLPLAVNVSTGRSYTFCEAVEKWGHLVTQSGLTMAYRKACPAFNGCLEQYFVILKEQASDTSDLFDRLAGPSGPNSSPLRTRGGRGSRGGRGFHGRPPYHGVASFVGRRPMSAGTKRPITEAIGTPSKHRK
jgi:hypothetical protein